MLFTVFALLAGLAAPALTSPLQFPGAAPLVPADTRVPNPCTTLDGTMCVFPFTYQGVAHYQCTLADSPVAWCATMVDGNGTVVTNNWGDCSNSATSNCPAETQQEITCSATSGAACVFPFRHLGIIYNECATVTTTNYTSSAAWCSTNTTAGGEHVLGSEAECSAACPMATTTTTAAPTTTTASTTTASTTTASSTTTTASSTTTATTSTTTASTTVTAGTQKARGPSCLTVSGPAAGEVCQFPFQFQGVRYSGCADWEYGGENTGKVWCSTRTDSKGNHVDGEGAWGICSSSCPNHSSLDFLRK